MPTYSVDWGGSYSGLCNDSCEPSGNCHNEAAITIVPVAGYLHGGGFACNGGGGDVKATVDLCGSASTVQVNVHTGTPCTAANKKCTVYVSIGCMNC